MQPSKTTMNGRSRNAQSLTISSVANMTKDCYSPVNTNKLILKNTLSIQYARELSKLVFISLQDYFSQTGDATADGQPVYNSVIASSLTRKKLGTTPKRLVTKNLQISLVLEAKRNTNSQKKCCITNKYQAVYTLACKCMILSLHRLGQMETCGISPGSTLLLRRKTGQTCVFTEMWMDYGI